MEGRRDATVRCPKCLNPEPAGSTHCRMCFAALDGDRPSAQALFRRSQATAAARAAAASRARAAPSRATRDPWVTRDAVVPTRQWRSPARPGPASAPPVRRSQDPVALLALVFGLCGGGPVAVLLGLWGRRRVHVHPARGGYTAASVGMWLGLATTVLYGYLLAVQGSL